jgi:ribosomal protein L1
MAETLKKANSKTAKTTVASKKTQTLKKPAIKVKKVTKEIADGLNQENSQIATEATSKAKELATTKAGKRSAKSLAEQEEKIAKEQRKTSAKSEPEQPKAKSAVSQQPARSRLDRRSKKYRKAAEQIEAGKTYDLKAGLELATKTSTTKFDASVELHIRLGVDPKQADQNIRDAVALPAGTGRAMRVAVFADGDALTAAKKAGADVAAGDELLHELDKDKIEFDILIATPAGMAKLGKYARLLGPKGLMPNPKSGTVTTDVAKAVVEAKAGRVEYRVDSTGIVHVAIGKVSFGSDKLLQNARAILTSVKNNKPSSLKSSYVHSIFVTTSMGPSVPVNINEAA